MPGLPAQTAQEYAVSLCDIVRSRGFARQDIVRTVMKTCAQSGFERADRLYVGSYFCDRYFLALEDTFFSEVAGCCAEYRMHATLTVPVFAQSTVQAGVQRVWELADKHPEAFDEITVNDRGMLRRLAHEASAHPALERVRVNVGRLMNRDPRDPRYGRLSDNARACRLDTEELEDLGLGGRLGMVELDPFAPIVDVSPLKGASIALHEPHCFMSTGHVCEAASTGRPVSKRYRAGRPCAQECLASYTLSHDVEACVEHDVYFSKLGRTVFFENPGCCVVGGDVARIVWTSADFAVSSAGGREEGSWE